MHGRNFHAYFRFLLPNHPSPTHSRAIIKKFFVSAKEFHAWQSSILYAFRPYHNSYLYAFSTRLLSLPCRNDSISFVNFRKYPLLLKIYFSALIQIFYGKNSAL